MENKGDLDSVDNELRGYTIDLNLPWMHKQYFVRDKNIIIEFGLCLFEALAWTIYAPFMAIKDIIFAFWYLITKQWYKLSLIAFVLDICILAVCALCVLFFISGLPAIIYKFGSIYLLSAGCNAVSIAVINTIRFMVRKEKVFRSYEVNDVNGNKKNVLLRSRIDDSKNEIEQNLWPISRVRFGHKKFYSYFDNRKVLRENKIAYGHSLFFLCGNFFTESRYVGIESGLAFSLVLHPIVAVLITFPALFRIFSRGKEEISKSISRFIICLILDLLFVLAVLYFIPGVPLVILRFGIGSCMTIVILNLYWLTLALLSKNCNKKIRLYPCKQGDKKYFKLEEDLSAGETRANAQEIKPSMGVSLPVRD